MYQISCYIFSNFKDTFQYSVSSTEGENEEYGNKHEESNVFVSKDGTQWNKFPFLITKTKPSKFLKTKLQKVMLSPGIIFI